ncbi:hypothetical protein [Saccharolobus caldissimus]|uniref:Calcium binding protein SSO6904 domain-containing protein n=1 Tax=Saccharolobus caldissimus TaxID=1702097 RepID=A0AAQ4CPW6_9CREN|nr:hypothetical protein [Saccharolobus caldissimus]BDB97847.1 hypothetical protein SACC_08640 [Saccharolobus caldissimus]
MSILEDPEFIRLREFKGKINIDIVAQILDEIELDLKNSKNIKTSIIYIYSTHLEEIRKNKELYDLIAEILQKYYQRIGIENVNQLILNTLR